MIRKAHPGGALVVIGVAALIFTNATNSLMQLSTEPSMRGRVMALRVGVALGGTPIGAPIVGWVADTFGPRWALGVHRALPLPAWRFTLWRVKFIGLSGAGLATIAMNLGLPELT